MTRAIAVRILALAAGIGLITQALLLDNLFGVNIPILSACLLAGAYVARPAGQRIDRLDLWLPAAAMALSLAVAVRADPTLLVLDLGAACALLGASMAAIAGEAVTRRSALRVVELGLLVLGWAGIGMLRVTAAAKRLGGPSAGDRLFPAIPPWAGAVGRGLLIAIPLLVVFGSLFSAADTVFDRLMGRLFTWQVELGEVPIRLAVAFLVAWAVAGLLAVASGVLVVDDAGPMARAGEPLPQSLGAAALGLPDSGDRASAGPSLRLGAIESATILVAVDVLFAIFVVLQVAYLFGGQDTLAATGLPYAQYARSGFFELVAVAFLAGGLLVAIHAIAARRTSVLVAAGLTLAALTAVVLASALLRLRIYQDAYGWTELRFYVLATIVWLAIGIGITMVLLARDRMGWLLHGLAIAAVVVLVGMNVVGPSRLIAEENVARVLNPALVPADGKSGLDVSYATRLGDDAIPALVRALPALAPRDRLELRGELIRRRDALEDRTATGWPSWNLGRELARDALATLGR
ncbi:MAG TPA: DUF4173 domain-containing protein [Candidatus Limnocylindrales bacterium]